VDVKAKIRLSPRPTYPSIFKSMDGDLSTLVQFVIDEHGRIDSNSIVVYTPPHQDFTDSIRHAMVRWKGTPARVAGRAVAQWALVNFEFAEECPARSTEPRWLRGTATLCVSRR
jgi:outer membrane biosynthesis protein TonB